MFVWPGKWLSLNTDTTTSPFYSFISVLLVVVPPTISTGLLPYITFSANCRQLLRNAAVWYLLSSQQTNGDFFFFFFFVCFAERERLALRLTEWELCSSCSSRLSLIIVTSSPERDAPSHLWRTPRLPSLCALPLQVFFFFFFKHNNKPMSR